MAADKSISTNIELLKEGVWDDRQYRPNWSGPNGVLGLTSAKYIPMHFPVVCGGLDDSTKRGLYLCVNNADLSNASSWKLIGTDFGNGIKLGVVNSLTAFPAFEFINDGDINSELVFGAATVTDQVLKAIGFRAGGDRGQNGAPAGRFPLRMELNKSGVRWCLPAVNANVGTQKNHFGVFGADGISELFYVDNTGNIRLVMPAFNGGDGDYVVIISADGTLKKLAQSAIKGTANAPANTAETIAGTDNTKFVTPFNLAAFWSDIKTRVQTITNNWNFTGRLMVNGADVLTTSSGDVANKLNIGDNTSLAGDEGRVSLLTATGKFISNSFIKFVALTRELQIGSAGNAGKLTVFSNVFNLEVQDNIADGQSFIRIPAGQEKALQIIDKNNVVYSYYRTIAGNQGVIINALQVFDQNIGMPVWRGQASITSAGANVKVYGLKADNSQFVIPLDTDTQSVMISAFLKVQNATGSIKIAAIMRLVASRVSGAISFTAPNITILSDNGTSPGFYIGVEPAGTTGIRFCFIPSASDNTAYTGGFCDITYSY